MNQKTIACLTGALLCGLAVAGAPAKAQAQSPAVSRNATVVPDVAAKVNPLPVGAAVPALTLRTPDGKAFNLSAALAEKPTVLIFYRGGWCPYCNTHLGKLSQIEDDLLKQGYRILAVSPDRPEELQKSIAKQSLRYQILSDSNADAAKAFGVAFRVDDGTVSKYKNSYKIDLEASSGQNHHILPVPAVFLIGTDGMVQYRYFNPDYKVRLEPEKILEAARAHSSKAANAAATPAKQKVVVNVCPIMQAEVVGEGSGVSLVDNYEVHFCCGGCKPQFDALPKKEQLAKIQAVLKKK
ncbi:MAG: hypothetical protein OHK0029_08880 [Armatimonadaceae bacterium]